MKLLSCMATHGRHILTERAIGSFLNQNYENKHLLIYNNSPVAQSLDKEYDNITLVNNHIDTTTGKEFANLGDIYDNIIQYIKDTSKFDSYNLINFQDNDDYALIDHISKGVDGYIRGGKKAYKPKYSWSLYLDQIAHAENTMEPSIFVEKDHVLEHGFSSSTVDQHLQWVKPLGWDDIFVDPTGKPTLVYDWSGMFSGEDSTNWKTSGDPGNPNNFDNCRKNSWDNGDLIYTPWTKEELAPFYEKILTHPLYNE